MEVFPFVYLFEFLLVVGIRRFPDWDVVQAWLRGRRGKVEYLKYLLEEFLSLGAGRVICIHEDLRPLLFQDLD